MVRSELIDPHHATLLRDILAALIDANLFDVPMKALSGSSQVYSSKRKARICLGALHPRKGQMVPVLPANVEEREEKPQKMEGAKDVRVKY